MLFRSFAYRSSIFKESGGKEIVLAATLRFKKGAPRKIAAEAREHIKYRRLRQPPYPNIGSIFENVPLAQIRADKGNLVKWVDVDSVSVRRHGDKDRRRLFVFPVKRDPFPVVPAARLIAEAGLKGEKCGGAMISPKHPNFIVNIGGAKAADVKCLIARAKKGVRRKFNVRLEEEVQMV